VDGFWAVQLCALFFAGLCALFLHWLERFGERIQEALIGATFVVLASASVLLLAADPHGGEHLSNALSGQILWVNKTQLMLLAAAAVIALLGRRYLRHPLLAFYIPFAIAITASVQAIGVYLVFASLIFPALAVIRLAGRHATLVGFGCGATGYVAGLSASLLLDLPSGPTLVVVLAITALLVNRWIAFARTG
jgi:zinc/manganese transport system permease protein